MTMGMRWRGTVGVSCAWMLVLVSTSMAQSVNGAAGGTGNLTRSFTIAGTAVNARTGEVLAQARISVEEVAAPSKAISMTTGANGHFAFAGLKLGKYRLSGAKSRRVRIALSTNSVNGACSLRSSLLLAS